MPSALVFCVPLYAHKDSGKTMLSGNLEKYFLFLLFRLSSAYFFLTKHMLFKNTNFLEGK